MNIKKKLKKIRLIYWLYDKFRIWSIRKAIYQQELLSRVVWSMNMFIDLENQYGTTKLNTAYLKIKVRGLHAFQIDLMDKAIGSLDISFVKKVTDLGDSSGAHLTYFKKGYVSGEGVEFIGVNIDEKAINKIQSRGFTALWRDIEYHIKQDTTDMAFMFETLEHLENPINVLRNIKYYMGCKTLIITVPYVKRSRVGLLKDFKNKKPEDRHLFELNPDDWGKIFTYCGWNVAYGKIYWQYPKKQLLLSYILGCYWEKADFEGFYGVVLKR